MAEEDLSQGIEAAVSEIAESVAEERQKTEVHEIPIPPAAGEMQPESKTRGILREAIQKVMQEIDHHEKEAEEHSRRAAELKRDLRESFTFLVKQEAGPRGIALPGEDRSGKAAEPTAKAKTKDSAAGNKRRPPATKKKPGSGKGGKG